MNGHPKIVCFILAPFVSCEIYTPIKHTHPPPLSIRQTRIPRGLCVAANLFDLEGIIIRTRPVAKAEIRLVMPSALTKGER